MSPARKRLARALAGTAAAASLAAGILGLGLVAAKKRHERATEVTFTRDVAPIVFRACAGCHRPGEAGPFDLLTYDDVADHAEQIVDVTGTRYMPPWKPVGGHGEYVGERSLLPVEIDVFRRWVRGGTRRGDPADAPPLPVWPTGWQLGKPDIVVQMTAPYTLPAEGKDVYRNFVIPSPVQGTRWVKAWELRAGTRTLHHAILNIDRTGAARKRDDADPEPGYAGMMELEGQSPDGFYLVWTPGKTPTAPAEGSSWRLDEHTDLVLQLHMQPTGKPESVEPTIGLFFAEGPPTRPRISLRLGDLPIDIPPGDRGFTMTDAIDVPVDVDVLSLFPHAHYVGRKVRCWAALPDGTRRSLLRIDDWDPAWQEEYTFKTPVFLPKGSTIGMEFSYDNSEDNVRNPNKPPKRIVTGEQSTSEMGNITIQVLPRDPREHVALREAKYRWQLRRTDDGRTNYNLANTLADEGKTDEAVSQYRRAIERDPKLAVARFNLAKLLAAQGELGGAIAEYREAITIRPTCGAYANLGIALAKTGKDEEATVAYQAAIALDAACAPAHNSLGAALAVKGDFAGAITHFEKALAVDPGNALSHVHLGRALEKQGRADEARAHYRRALVLQPGFAEARAALDALDAVGTRTP